MNALPLKSFSLRSLTYKTARSPQFLGLVRRILLPPVTIKANRVVYDQSA